ncbi:dipeptide/oligopeptide/nickel ABC transporter permease/ATP-binding protein [Alloscardovia macacae]|uniref:ABC transporter ATP-binding protein n=1 Tax=Alloscardovia macacae TaxID=1160091 RepID=A0A261F6K8_9BIFI|nr:dipeptide/oligopeptide/nickel ABC transporter permease/ATP-binding protein [Alloscardovia macacae]OZG54789.1 ABC transporter ATP-binding protein [Alloscardovia macacae]
MLFGKNSAAHAASQPGVKLRRFAHLKMGTKLAALFIALLILVAIFAPLFSPHDPLEITMSYQAPSADHLFGTDNLGRDVMSRVFYGARFSLAIGLGAIAFALVFGALIGAIAAVSRPWVSEIIMRIVDIFMSVPGIALAAVFVTILGQSMFGIIVAIGILYVPQITRVVRANIISEYGQDYVRAVIVSGARAPWILVKHVARNIAAPVMVFTTLSVADAIVFEASLSFINLGFPEPTPTWGNILSSAKQGVIFGYWWQALYPGLAIMITVLCLNILSEGITDAIVSAPSAPVVKNAVDAEQARKEDLLLADPVAAYEAQHESLVKSLEQLKEAESKRTDRFVPVGEQAGEPVIEVKDLCISFPRHGDVNVVDHVSFYVRPGETMGLVGESGCGKSITSLTIMGLLDKRAKISGEINFDGKNLVGLDPKEHNALRGNEIAMIYQDALSSLNPSMLIKNQMAQLTKRGGTRTAEELLTLVGLDPKRVLESYPHELSGGQRQRVLIAMALTRDPKLIIADEPTTALDVTVQRQVIDLLNELREKLGFAMIFVSHDLALVAKVAHKITVMYAGQVVEQGSTQEILTDPRHEYTRGLLGSVISIEAGQTPLHQVPGTVPSPKDFPEGDRFAPRSSHPYDALDEHPVMIEIPDTHHRYAVRPSLSKLDVDNNKAGHQGEMIHLIDPALNNAFDDGADVPGDTSNVIVTDTTDTTEEAKNE